MRICYLQHEDAVGPGWVEPWALGNGHHWTRCYVGRDEPLPDLASIDGLVVLGGEMNVDQDRQFPWLIKEKRFLEQALKKDLPIFGICLGGQLMAEILGAKVGPVEEPEFGWFPVHRAPENQTAFFEGPLAETMTFHWHGYGFEIPQGAIRLASSEGCPNQAYLYQRKVFGTQFHPEVTPALLKEYLKDEVACGGTKFLSSLAHKTFVQSAASMMAGQYHANAQRSFCWSLLDQFFCENMGVATNSKS